MKKIIGTIAAKMEPGIIQNLLARIASKTPKMFADMQLYGVAIAGILAIIIEAMQKHTVPDFSGEDMVILGLKFFSAMLIAAAGSLSLHTEDSSLHQQSNAMDITHSDKPLGPPVE